MSISRRGILQLLKNTNYETTAFIFVSSSIYKRLWILSLRMFCEFSIRGLCLVSVHREGVNPNSMEGVPESWSQWSYQCWSLSSLTIKGYVCLSAMWMWPHLWQGSGTDLCLRPVHWLILTSKCLEPSLGSEMSWILYTLQSHIDTRRHLPVTYLVHYLLSLSASSMLPLQLYMQPPAGTIYKTDIIC